MNKLEEKKFAELELIGIVGTYRESQTLFVITRDGNIWMHYPYNDGFKFFKKLP